MTESERQDRLRRDQLLLEEQLTFQKLLAQGFISGAGGSEPANWQVVTNTIWLYPIADIEAAAAATTLEFTRSGNRFFFNSIADIDQFYGEVYNLTAVAQPVGNAGYSIAVGSQLEGSYRFIYLDLVNGLNIVTWQEMRLITPQGSLQAGGNAPDGTVGYGAVRVDLNGDGVAGTVTETTGGQIDPLRFIQI